MKAARRQPCRGKVSSSSTKLPPGRNSAYDYRMDPVPAVGEHTEAILRAQDRQANLVKLQGLLPELAQAMVPAFDQAHDWAGVRCTLPDRVPAVGPLAPQRLPGLHICSGLGARGLTLSVLCGELLAALLHGEPWPTERKLAQALLAERFERKAS